MIPGIKKEGRDALFVVSLSNGKVITVRVAVICFGADPNAIIRNIPWRNLEFNLVES